jgi:riboflavin kinase / FMN adenylyltransferase
VKVVSRPEALEPARRAVAIGTFDGVHLGHRRVIEAARAAGGRSTVVTFHPHPRTILGNRVELLSTVGRRLELIDALGVEETLVVEFTLDLARLPPEEFAESVLRRIGAEVVVAGPGFRFGRGASGDLDLLRSLGFDARTVPFVEGVSSSTIRKLLSAGQVREAAQLLGRPAEV